MVRAVKVRSWPGEVDVTYRLRINGKNRDIDVPGEMLLALGAAK